MNDSETIGEEQEDTGRLYTLEIKDAAHQAVLRIQQEEIIQELRRLTGEIEALRHMVEHSVSISDRQTVITEVGLRNVSLVPVTICFLMVGSYFFYAGKVSEPFFGALMFVLMLPSLGQWMEKGMKMMPVVGDLIRKQKP